MTNHFNLFPVPTLTLTLMVGRSSFDPDATPAAHTKQMQGKGQHTSCKGTV